MGSMTLLGAGTSTSIPAPDAPTNPALTNNASDLTLTWDASVGATTYNVYRGTSSGGETLLASGQAGSPYVDYIITPGTHYYYKVSAVNAGGESSLSSEVDATFTATLVDDTFTDTNGTNITAHTIAPTNTPATSWTVGKGTADIQSNTMNVTALTSAYYVAAVNAAVADCTVQATANSTGSWGPVGRYGSGTSFWGVYVVMGGGTMYLVEDNATIRATAAGTTISTNDVVKLIMSGTSLTAWHSSGSCNYTSSAKQANTSHGVYGETVGRRFDNFKITVP